MVILVVQPMRIIEPRWGEVIVRKQGGQKNKFDKSMSFSVSNEPIIYEIGQYWEILKLATELTRFSHYSALRNRMIKIKKELELKIKVGGEHGD